MFYLLISERSKNVFVMSWVSNKLSFEEGNVNDRRVEIYKLEDEDFEGEIVVILSLGPVHF